MTNINLPGEAESERAYMGSPALRIRELNDRFRAYIKGTGNYQGAGLLLVTRGVAARGDDFVTRAIDATCAFSDFTDDNDPYFEHDFGNFELDGETIFWKIDYYDRENPNVGSEDPADTDRTKRVLTVMLAAEY